MRGPIIINGKAVGALLLGRSSATIMGLFVLPGVIDADFSGEIMIMAHTPFPPIKIPKGQRIAQLVPLPQITNGLAPRSLDNRGQGGFGSTGGLTLLTIDLSSRPKKTVHLSYQNYKLTLTGLLDTGADTSIISPEQYPSNWPLHATANTVTGIGGMTLASRSPIITVEIEGKTTAVAFSIVQLPPTVQCLIGRDVLSQLGVVLTNEHPLA